MAPKRMAVASRWTTVLAWWLLFSAVAAAAVQLPRMRGKFIVDPFGAAVQLPEMRGRSVVVTCAAAARFLTGSYGDGVEGATTVQREIEDEKREIFTGPNPLHH